MATLVKKCDNIVFIQRSDEISVGKLIKRQRGTLKKVGCAERGITDVRIHMYVYVRARLEYQRTSNVLYPAVDRSVMIRLVFRTVRANQQLCRLGSLGTDFFSNIVISTEN